jgi:hypothetical protein
MKKRYHEMWIRWRLVAYFSRIEIFLRRFPMIRS